MGLQGREENPVARDNTPLVAAPSPMNKADRSGSLLCLTHPRGSRVWYAECLQNMRVEQRLALGRVESCVPDAFVLSTVLRCGSPLAPVPPVTLDPH